MTPIQEKKDLWKSKDGHLQELNCAVVSPLDSAGSADSSSRPIAGLAGSRFIRTSTVPSFFIKIYSSVKDIHISGEQ
jgi:hypothetical protein